MNYRFLRFPDGKQKAVTFSYDDGCRDDIRLAETLNRYKIKCTFNINSALISEKEGEWRLTAEEIKRYLIDSGHEIAIHGKYHKAMGKLRPIDGIREVLECRQELEKTFGMIIRGMAYPDTGITEFSNNTNYKEIRNYLKDLDICYARTLNGDNDRFELPTDFLAWMPTAHHTNPKLFDYINKFKSITGNEYCSVRTPKLFYLWGHSFEYGSGGFDLLEKICGEISGLEDVWYATNMEIYDYVTAYNSLIFSADSKTVYNPTLLKVWFDIGGKIYSVNSGETITIE